MNRNERSVGHSFPKFMKQVFQHELAQLGKLTQKGEKQRELLATIENPENVTSFKNASLNHFSGQDMPQTVQHVQKSTEVSCSEILAFP